MKIDFENYGRFYCSLTYVNGEIISYRASSPYTLKECASFIENRMSFCDNVTLGVIYDWNTDEAVATVENESKPDPSIYECDLDYNWSYEDMGIDPYQGCFPNDF